MRKLLLLIMLLPVFLFGQSVRIMDTENLFSDTETIQKGTNAIPYFTMTNTDTATSKLIVFSGGRSGDVRVTVVMDNISGTLSATVKVGLQIGHFGSNDLDYDWVTLGTISASDNNTSKTYLVSDLAEFASPVAGYKVRIETSDTQSDKVYVNVLQYYPNK